MQEEPISKLDVHKIIVINAPVSTVWRVLTENQFINQWWQEFDAYGGVESDWQVGGGVIWKNRAGAVYVKGTVDAATINRLLQFTTFDVKKPGYTITFTFSLTRIEQDSTQLTIDQGDFARIPDGEHVYRVASDIWDRTLPKIKSLAEVQ